MESRRLPKAVATHRRRVAEAGMGKARVDIPSLLQPTSADVTPGRRSSSIVQRHDMLAVSLLSTLLIIDSLARQLRTTSVFSTWKALLSWSGMPPSPRPAPSCANTPPSAGVSGLTSALLLARVNAGSITVVGKHMPGDYDIEYASPWAGANFSPYAHRLVPSTGLGTVRFLLIRLVQNGKKVAQQVGDTNLARAEAPGRGGSRSGHPLAE